MPLNKEQIIEESLKLLNESGIEGVTLRKIASRLGVHASALYWHFAKKEVLVNEMAEAILKAEFATLEPGAREEPWQGWLVKNCNRVRKALLAYRDGGRVVAGAHLSLTMARISEVSIQTLLNSGLTLHRARLISLTGRHFTMGFVIEEQTPPPTEGVAGFNLDQYKRNFPLIVEGITEYFESGRTVDDLFNDGLKIIVGEPGEE